MNVTKNLGHKVAPSTSRIRRKRLSALPANEQAALLAFVERLGARYGNDLRRVVLFGSKARGDDDTESDFDLLVVVRGVNHNYQMHWNEIVNIAWGIELTYGIVISLVVKDETDYATMRQHRLLLARNIERDGIQLWTTKPGVPTSQSASPKHATT